MSLQTIRTLVRSLLDESTAAQFTDVQLNSWINAAERHIAVLSGCYETIQPLTTTPGDRKVTFVGDRVNYVEFLIGGTYIFIPGGSTQWQDTDDTIWQDTNDVIWQNYTHAILISNPPVGPLRYSPHNLGHMSYDETSAPQFWFQWGNYIVVDPKPATTYNLNAYVSRSDFDVMTTDGASPTIPAEFVSAIIPYVLYRAKIKARKYREAAQSYAEYIVFLQSLIDKYRIRRPAKNSDIRMPDVVREVR
jgi:hypothetical protein